MCWGVFNVSRCSNTSKMCNSCKSDFIIKHFSIQGISSDKQFLSSLRQRMTAYYPSTPRDTTPAKKKQLLFLALRLMNRNTEFKLSGSCLCFAILFQNTNTNLKWMPIKWLPWLQHESAAGLWCMLVKIVFWLFFFFKLKNSFNISSEWIIIYLFTFSFFVSTTRPEPAYDPFLDSDPPVENHWFRL